MRLNADFSRRAVSSANNEEWICSPESGVDRRMLDRIGDEVARATSVVRYAPGSSFPEHRHPEGEEFLVLEGVFSDEHGHYPRGTYVRNPPGSGHSPFSVDGCRILVKLRQFDARDLLPVTIDTSDDADWQPDERTGGEVRVLHQYGTEEVSMLRFEAGRDITINVDDSGLEWLLFSGTLRLDASNCPAESWFRFPAGDKLTVQAIDDCVLWQKTGHLPSS